ncbi:MAG: hypothetical protein U9Q71_04760, partial [Pseudomonadota bacterium]|nr:hypothetical protein [Pseudomonadota bacterium]
FMGVDVSQVRAMEKDLDEKYGRLTLAVRDELKESGKSIAEEHQRSLKRAHEWIRKDSEAIAEQKPGLSAVAPHRLFCWCYTPSMVTAVDQGDSVILDPPAGGTGSGSATFDTNGAHPFAEAQGQGTGTINTAQVNAWFKYAFTPSTDRVYCIHPIVQMNGHWLTWTWGTCGGTPEDRGIASARVKLKVRADQLSSTIKQSEHIVIDENASAGANKESGWYYDSEVDGGTKMDVILQGGHEAVIFVEVECLVSVANHGRAWVDMQTSPHFYFKAPELWWGPVYCWSW